MERGRPKVSIIIPVYNSESFLEGTIDSARRQTVENMEIICVDDGSTDGSGELLDQYAALDSRIKVYHIGDQGVGRARNFGIENASGEYIMFLDADDYLSEHAVETALAMIEEEKADMVIYAAEVFPEDSERYEEVSGRFPFRRNVFAGKVLTEELIFSSSGVNLYIWNKIYRRSMLVEHNLGFSEELGMLEDRAFLFDVIPWAGRIVTSPDMLYRYRLENAGSITGKVKKNFLYKTQKHLDLLQHIFTSWREKKGISNKAHQELVKWSLHYVYQNHYMKLSEKEQEGIRSAFEKIMLEFYPEYEDSFRAYFYI